MIRTAFALLAVATLAKNDVSGRSRLADACTGILCAFADDVWESHSQHFAPMVSLCPSRNTRDVGNWAASFSGCHAESRVVGPMRLCSGVVNRRASDTTICDFTRLTCGGDAPASASRTQPGCRAARHVPIRGFGASAGPSYGRRNETTAWLGC